MSPSKKTATSMSSYHVSVSAEAFAAAFLAQASCDVSVQYGANQPEYDLIAHKGNRFMKVSVKGSQAGGWGFVQSYKRGRSYHEAIDEWASRQSNGIVYCFIQFWDIAVGQAPRAYLATVPEIAKALKDSRNGLGNTTLVEKYSYTRGIAKGHNDHLPEHWKFTVERVDDILTKVAGL